MGESLVSIRENAPLEQVTTASLPALRKYSEALRLEEEDKLEATVAVLQEAVALDTGFAMAYRKLAVLLGNMGGNETGQVAAATRAYSHRDRLPELEADLTTGYYHQFVDYDPVKTIAAYRAALSINPDNTVALNNLAVTLVNSREWVEAESLAVHATRYGAGRVVLPERGPCAGRSRALRRGRTPRSRTRGQGAGEPRAAGSQGRRRPSRGRRDYAAGTRLLRQPSRPGRPAPPGRP